MDFDRRLISSFDLSAEEVTDLNTAVFTYGPAVKAAFRQLHGAKKQLGTDALAIDHSSLQAQLSVNFEDRLNVTTARLLASYSRFLEKR